MKDGKNRRWRCASTIKLIHGEPFRALWRVHQMTGSNVWSGIALQKDHHYLLRSMPSAVNFDFVWLFWTIPFSRGKEKRRREVSGGWCNWEWMCSWYGQKVLYYGSGSIKHETYKWWRWLNLHCATSIARDEPGTMGESVTLFVNHIPLPNNAEAAEHLRTQFFILLILPHKVEWTGPGSNSWRFFLSFGGDWWLLLLASWNNAGKRECDFIKGRSLFRFGSWGSQVLF